MAQTYKGEKHGKKLLAKKWKDDFSSSIQTLPRSDEMARERIKTAYPRSRGQNKSSLFSLTQNAGNLEAYVEKAAPKPDCVTRTQKSYHSGVVPRDQMHMAIEPETAFKHVPQSSQGYYNSQKIHRFATKKAKRIRYPK